MSSSTSMNKILLLCLLMSMAFSVSAAEKKKKEVINIPLYQGVQIGLDLGSPLSGLLSGSGGAAVSADVNLRNKYFPTIQLGHASYDKTSDTGIHFTTSGQYFKLGVNKALAYSGTKAENLFYAGAHCGFSSFSYSLDNLVSNVNYWGKSTATSLQDEKSTAGWIELVAGVRVQVLGPLSLGWNVQYRSTLHVSNGNYSIPAYIPGYGQNYKPKPAMTFHLYYRLPL